MYIEATKNCFIMRLYPKQICIIFLLLIAAGTAIGKEYRGAEIRTLESFTYGKFEVNMKSAQASGVVSSFFTFYDNPDFMTNWNEIDIEFLGKNTDDMQCNPIVPGENGRESHEKHVKLDFNPHEEFRTYGFEWTPTYIAWFVDGKEVYRDDNDYIKKMNLPQKIMMNIWPAVWEEWVGPVDNSRFPVYAVYDWVAYYDYTPERDETFTLRWRDDFKKMDMTRWQLASHTFEGNLCDFVPENAEIKDGKLYLKLSKAQKTGGTAPATTPASPAKLTGGHFKKGKIRVNFSEEIDRSSAINPDHYRFENESIRIKKIRYHYDFKSVIIVLSNPNAFLAGNKTVIVDGVKDKSMPPNTVTGKISIETE